MSKGPERAAQYVPFIGGFLVFAAYRIFYVAAEIHYLNVGLSAKDLRVVSSAQVDNISAALGPLSWSVTGIFFFLAFIGTLFTLSWQMRPALQGRTLRTAVVAIALVTVGSLDFRSNPFAVDGLNAILTKSFDLLNMPYAGVLLAIFTPMVIVVLVFLMVASWSTLAHGMERSDSPDANLRAAFRNLNTGLFAGATMLVAGIVHANALHRLPSALIDPEAAENWNLLVEGFSASTGAVWTFLLLGIYLPSLFVLQSRAHALALSTGENLTRSQVNDWLSEKGLASHTPEKLAQVLAFLSPFLVGGAASPLLQLVSG